MRELILQGGDVLKFDEENRSGKTDLEVSDIFPLHGVNITVYTLFHTRILFFQPKPNILISLPVLSRKIF